MVLCESQQDRFGNRVIENAFKKLDNPNKRGGNRWLGSGHIGNLVKYLALCCKQGMGNIGFSFAWQIIRRNKIQIEKLMLWVCLLIAVDQATKLLAQNVLENHSGIILIPNLLSLRFLKNEISHFHQFLYYFVISFILCPAALLYAYAKSFPRLVIAGITLLWSATLSNNIIDAFSLGYIRDFIDLHGIAVGNIADQYRNAGVAVVVAGLVIKDGEKINAGMVFKIIMVALAALTLTALFWKYLSKYCAI